LACHGCRLGVGATPATNRGAGQAEAQDHHRPGSRFGHAGKFRRRDDDRRIHVGLQSPQDAHVVDAETVAQEAGFGQEDVRVADERGPKVDATDHVVVRSDEGHRPIAPVEEVVQATVEDDHAVVVDDLEVQLDREEVRPAVDVLEDVDGQVVEVGAVGQLQSGEAGCETIPTDQKRSPAFVAGDQNAADAAGQASVGSLHTRRAEIGLGRGEGRLAREVSPRERLERRSVESRHTGIRRSGSDQSECAGQSQQVVKRILHS